MAAERTGEKFVPQNRGKSAIVEAVYEVRGGDRSLHLFFVLVGMLLLLISSVCRQLALDPGASR